MDSVLGAWVPLTPEPAGQITEDSGRITLDSLDRVHERNLVFLERTRCGAIEEQEEVGAQIDSSSADQSHWVRAAEFKPNLLFAANHNGGSLLWENTKFSVNHITPQSCFV